MTAADFLKAITGHWEGEVSTWFEPGVLADVSRVQGIISPLLNGLMLKHEYQGEIQSKPRSGCEWIAFNKVTQNFETAWVDSFHMNYAIMHSSGPQLENGFSVFGQYDVGEGHPRWGWRTEFRLLQPDELTILAFNVSPEGMEDLAVETKYLRRPGN
jgi:hypothetical protein